MMHKIGNRYTLSIVLWFALTTIFATYGNELHYRVKRLKLRDGLSHTDVLSIAQDSVGFIWLGTFNGLNRYDGYGFNQFFSTDTTRPSTQNRIQQIAIKNEKLWMATDGGIGQFDLRRECFIPLSANNKNANYTALNTHPFKKIFIDSDNLKWVLESNKVMVLDDREPSNIKIVGDNEILNFPQNMGDLNFNDIIEDQFKNIWIATYNGLIQLHKNGRNIEYVGLFYNYVDWKPDGWKNFIANIYINNDGLLIYSNSNNVMFHKLSLTENKHTKIDLVMEKRMEPRVFQDRKIFEYSYFTSITQSKYSGDYWFFSNGFIHHAKNYTDFKYPDVLYNSTNTDEDFNLNSLTVTTLMLDRSGCLFVGSYENNLYIIDLNQKPFNWISSKTSATGYYPQGKSIRTIFEDEDGQLWFGSTSGIALFNKLNGKSENFYQLNDIVNLPKKNIHCISGNGDGKIWIGTNLGVEIYDKHTRLFSYITIQELIDNGINADLFPSIAFDKFGKTWLGSSNEGIVIVDITSNGKRKFSSINNNHSELLTSQKINFILSDTAKNEILATTNNGFNRILLDKKGNVDKIIKYKGNRSLPASISSNMIFPIAKYNDSTYFLGTLGGGLNKVVISGNKVDKNGYGEYKASYYDIKNGLPSNDVEGLLIDDKRRIWCAGNMLSVFDTINNRFINYNTNDGIKVEAFKVTSCFKSKSNILYFGGVDGITYFDPNKIEPNRIKSNVVITTLLVNGIPIKPSFQKNAILKEQITYTKKITLNYRQNDFALRFASMHYANSINNIFKYRLIGFDNDWKTTKPGENEAKYTNLPYGTYTFEVWGTNNDQLWFDECATLLVKITPPWWQSSFAYIIYVVLFLALLVSIYYNQYRLYKAQHQLKLVEIEEKKKEELLNTKLQFFTNISHEFRTPLTFIISPLLELKSKSRSRETSYSLNLALKYANRLLRLVDQLIQFRKTESGLDKVSYSQLNINQVINNIVGSFIIPAQKSEIELSVNLLKHPLETWIDAVKLETILYNLLSNAFKSVKKIRKISVTVIAGELPTNIIDKNKYKYEIVSENFDNPHYSILVSDSGIGINEESLPLIFDRFYNQNTENHVGYGIGLALLKNLVLLLNGRIIITSKSGVGTDFLISFPKVTPLENEIEKNIDFSDNHRFFSPQQIEYSETIEMQTVIDHSEPFEKKRTILIVEDNIELRNYLNAKLSQDFFVISAENGRVGIEMAKQKMPDLIISDVMMPIADGLELCQTIKEDFDTCHIPIILLTAKTEIEDKLKGIENGADDYISKPFSLEYLVKKANSVIQNRDTLIAKYTNDAVLNAKSFTTEKGHVAFTEKLISLIKANMAEPNFSLELLYTHLGLSRSIFFEKVKEATQLTPAEFVKQVRLKLGIQYLMNNDGLINEAATFIGMSASNFTREFKTVYKKTPREFLAEKQ